MGGEDSKPQVKEPQHPSKKESKASARPDTCLEDIQNKKIAKKAEGTIHSVPSEPSKPIRLKKTKPRYFQSKFEHLNSIRDQKAKQMTMSHSDESLTNNRVRLQLLLSTFNVEVRKPIVEYDHQSKGVVLKEQSKKSSEWDRLIADGHDPNLSKVRMLESYISINEQAPGGLKMKQIKKRLSDIKTGHLSSWDSEIIQEMHYLQV